MLNFQYVCGLFSGKNESRCQVPLLVGQQYGHNYANLKHFSALCPGMLQKALNYPLMTHEALIWPQWHREDGYTLLGSFRRLTTVTEKISDREKSGGEVSVSICNRSF